MGGPRPRYDRLRSLLEALHSEFVLSQITELLKSAQLPRTVQSITTVLITRKSRSKNTALSGRDLSPLKACVDRYAFTQIDNNF